MSTNNTKAVLITGASGFIGKALVKALNEKGFETYGIGRSLVSDFYGTKYIQMDLEKELPSKLILEKITSVVHLAGQAHGKGHPERQHLDGFRLANLLPTIELAKLSIASGVKRFIFVSSIGVHGRQTHGIPISEDSSFSPYSPYTMSKYEAEEALRKLFNETTESELVIVRPPLVYSIDAPGNFKSLLRIVRSGFPLPFQRLTNRRNIISATNFTNFLFLCLMHPDAADQVFVISELNTVSTRDIVCSLRAGMGKTPRLFSLPLILFKFVFKIFGISGKFTQLYGDLEIDSSKAINLLGWNHDQSTVDQLIDIGKKVGVPKKM